MTARVAVVEDDPDVRELVRDILVARGYDVAAFEDVGRARSGLQAFAPDLLILDVELPDGSGLELVGSVQGEDGKPVPSIVLSSLKSEADMVRGFVSGATDYLTKPFKKEELLARCSIHLARRGSEAEEPDETADLPMRDGLAFGRYRVERLLGRGGYGAVYLVRDAQRGGARAALKVLGLFVGEQLEARLRFVREGYAAGSVSSQRVAAVHDVGCEQGRQYYSMDYIEGPSLHAYVKQRGTLDEAEVRGLARGLLEGLQALERSGLVHRDLKPDNIILRGRRIDDPVLVDFGLAKRPCDRGVTRADVLVGTPAYLPPEVIDGAVADARSDLYQLGLVLRYALDGCDPFPSLDGLALMSAITRDALPPVGVFLDRGFAALLRRLTARDPELRPRSAEEALQELLALEGSPPTRRVTRRAPPPAVRAPGPGLFLYPPT